jgi:hypothetical protein
MNKGSALALRGLGIETHTGLVSYDDAHQVAFLDSAVLAIDQPPFGFYTLNEVAQAFRHCRAMGVQQGDTLTVLGVRDVSGPRDVIAVVRFLRSNS